MKNLLHIAALSTALLLTNASAHGAAVTIEANANQSGFSSYSLTPFPVATFDFGTSASLFTSIDSISISLQLNDADTAPGNFDYNNLTLLLDGFNTGIVLNGFRDNFVDTLTFTGLPTNAASIITALLLDGELIASIADATPNDNYVEIPSTYSSTLSVTGDVAAVPETSTWVMGFLALGATVFLARRKASRQPL